MPEDEIQGNGFTIKDRRAFDAEGKVKEETKEQGKKEGKYRNPSLTLPLRRGENDCASGIITVQIYIHNTYCLSLNHLRLTFHSVIQLLHVKHLLLRSSDRRRR